MAMRTRVGVTLVELVVTLGILGLTLAVTGLGIRSLAPTADAIALRELENARRAAIETGTSTTVEGGGRFVRFAPDGSAAGGPIVTDSLVLFVDPLTGIVRSERRSDSP
jgi:type II secretory pathway pseudopilin PulG